MSWTEILTELNCEEFWCSLAEEANEMWENYCTLAEKADEKVKSYENTDVLNDNKNTDEDCLTCRCFLLHEYTEDDRFK